MKIMNNILKKFPVNVNIMAQKRGSYMFKKGKIAFCLIAIILCAILLTGCSETEGNNNKNTSTGKKESVSVKDLNENIVISDAVTKKGKLVVFATNNNKVSVDMEIEVEFYDADENLIDSANEQINAVGAQSEIAKEFWGTPEDFDHYKIYVDVKETSKECFVNELTSKHNDTGKQITVQVENTTETEIEFIEAAVVYYQGETVVGYDYQLVGDIKPERSANFNLDYPYDKNYKKVNFDSYKVFINEAYNY